MTQLQRLFKARKARTEQAEGMWQLRALEDLGYSLGIMSVPKTPGRKRRSAANTAKAK